MNPPSGQEDQMLRPDCSGLCVHVHTHAVRTSHWAHAQGRNLNSITWRCFNRSIALAINTLPWSDLGSTSEHLPHMHYTQVIGHGEASRLVLLEGAQGCNSASLVTGSPCGSGGLFLWVKPLLCLLLPSVSLAISHLPSPVRPLWVS